MIYSLLRPALFRLDAESAHQLAVAALNTALSSHGIRKAVRVRCHVEDPALRVTRFGIDFPNPVGLAAGFDKSGASFNPLGALGFGHVEIGTVTAHAQAGNDRPRLFRLPADQALLNRMGFNNPGAEAVAARLSEQHIEPVLGINIGKSKVTPLEEATGDYLRSLELLEPYARYLVVNVSSPNTPGLRALQDAEPLRALLRALVGRTRNLRPDRPCPVLLKIAPDLSDPQVEEAAAIAGEEGAAGLIATNTTIRRDHLVTPSGQVESLGAGGISGPPVRARALEVVARVYRVTGGTLPIIGVGGIAGADDAWRMIRAGASLVQVWTGFVYRGTALPREICLGLLREMRREGMESLEDAVGADHR